MKGANKTYSRVYFEKKCTSMYKIIIYKTFFKNRPVSSGVA